MSNILDNAVKYTPEGGEIALSARVDDGHIAIAVEDSGVGFEPDAAVVLFKPFAQPSANRVFVGPLGAHGLIILLTPEEDLSCEAGI